LRRGVGLLARHLPTFAMIAAATWIPVYALLGIAAIGLDVSGHMAAVVGSIRSGHSPDGLAVYALALYAVVSILLTLVAVPLSHGALITAVAAVERHTRVDVRGCYRLACRRHIPFLGVVAVLAALIILGLTVL